jgi:hypothetical protein
MVAAQQLGSTRAGPTYERRQPERSPLYQTLLHHGDAFLAETRVPTFVARAFRRFLHCGLLAKGFLRVRCVECRAESLVAFSCKDRSFCPSCTARRSAETAAHLVDAVLPRVALRQYVLAMPPDLHHRFVRDAALESKALGLFLDELRQHLQTTAGVVGEPGFVTFVQHFGSTLNLHVHFHVLALDGVYVREGEQAPRFVRARTPTNAEVSALVERAARRIRRATGRTDPEDVPVVEAPLLKLVLPPDDEPVDPESPAKELTAEHDGFNLHAATHFAANERAAVERFCRYAARGPLALSRLSLAPNGHVIYRLKQPRPDGTSHVVFSPQSLLTRLSWLVVLPGVHLTRYHGILAPNHAWRSLIVRQPPVPLPGLHCRPRRRLDWATLLKRVFALEVLVCTACGGERRIIAEIKEGPIARRILAHLGLPTTAPKPAQGNLLATGPPSWDEPEPPPAWSDSDFDQRLPHSDPFA